MSRHTQMALCALVALLLVAPAVAEPPGAENPLASRIRRAVDRLLREAPVSSAVVGIAVADVETGSEWLTVHPDRSLNPASVLKLFTGAVALDRLGPDHRFRTEILADGDTVYLRGDGDPLLTTKRLSALVRKASKQLRQTTVKRVVVDDSAFGGGVLPPEFGKKKTDASYRAGAGAVALDLGTVRVSVRPTRLKKRPRIEVSPPGAYFIIENQARTVRGKKSTIHVRTRARGDRTVVVVQGKLGRKHPAVHATRRIEHPPLAAAYALARLLRRHRIEIASDAPIELDKAPAAARVLADTRSEPLRELVAQMNKHSINFVAEMLLRGLVQPESGPATWRLGRQTVERWLIRKVGLEPESFTYRNGSGLYDGGRFSARQVVRLLLHMDRHPHRDAFRDSLSVAGHDGTLARRLKGHAGRVIGKTGTLNNVSALSGYARNRSGRLFAFSILVNETDRKTAAMRRFQDGVCALLIDTR